MLRDLVFSGASAMISSSELDDLMVQSLRDLRKEPAFFRALLDAIVYAHAPPGNQSERLRLVMFKSPDDGEFVVPVFTDEAKAEFAARGNVRIVSMTGRALLNAIRCTAVMINPNDARCTLYPEEISELLATGSIALVQKGDFTDDETECFKLEKPPRTLIKALKKSLPGIRGVEVAFVAGLKWRQVERPDSVLIALGGRAGNGEREVRSAITALHRMVHELVQEVDLLHFDSKQPAPEWIHRLGLTPVYRCRFAAPGSTSKYN